MRFGILGPLEVADQDVLMHIGGRKPRTLLAVLLVHANEIVSTDALAEAVWPESHPDEVANALHTQISRLRKVINAGEASGGDRLERISGGYRLHVADHELDAFEFEGLCRRSREALAVGSFTAVEDTAQEALACWRGRALVEFADQDFARTRAVQLESQRLTALECRIEAGLALGRHRDLITELEELVVAHPLRESLRCQLILALYRSGRSSEALRAFERARITLAEELGISPSRELTQLQQSVLEQDPSLDLQPRADVVEVVAPAATHPPSAELPGQGDGVRHNLPRPSTSLVGRSSDRAEVADALEKSRLVTLTGPGGCGKTRLALAVGEDVVDRYPGGVWLVDLSAITGHELVVRAIAEPLGATADDLGQVDQICRRVGDDPVLLILDNCEHVVDAVAKVVEACLGATPPTLRILATSREELLVGAELVWRVSPLSVPPQAAAGNEPTPYTESDAVRLFIQRGRSALSAFDPDGESLAEVAQICRRLDGLPLAIELAAALVGSLPVSTIARRIDDRFRLLDTGRRGRVERHQTLRATLDWSFELLDESARQLFAQLGVFVGDFNLEAAEAVAGTEADTLAVARGLGRLVRTSMVLCITGPGGADRYRMLETVRSYARERLHRLDDADEVYQRHARYYAGLTAEVNQHIHGPDATQWLSAVNTELPNLRAAVAWCIDHNDVETGLELTASLNWCFGRIGLLDESARWLDVWLARREQLPPKLRLRALNAAGTTGFIRGVFHQDDTVGEEWVELARQLDDPHQLAVALIVQGSSAVYQGDLDRAESCLVEAESLCLRQGDRWRLAWALLGRGVSSRRAGSSERARQQLEESLRLFRAHGDQHSTLLPLIHLALVAHDEGRFDDALGLADKALIAARELKDRGHEHIALCVLGWVHLSLGDASRAREMLLSSLRGFVGAYHWLMVSIALDGLADLAAKSGRPADSVALLGFTDGVRRRSRLALSDKRASERARWLDLARELIGEASVESALHRGEDLLLDEAIALAERATADLDGMSTPIG